MQRDAMILKNTASKKNPKKSGFYRLSILSFSVLLLIGGSNLMGQQSVAPSAITDAASDVSYYSATLNAQVASNGDDTSVSFQLGTDTSYGTTVTADPSTVLAGSGSASVSIEGFATDLLSNTEYHYRVVATNSSGTTYGDDVTFTTLETVPEIYVSGGGNAISDGSTSPTTSNLTDFGSTPVTGGFVVKNFSIQNTGNGDLDLNGSPIVSISGTHAADFSVTVQPSSTTVAPSSSVSFTVKFDPSATGLRTASVSISNNDSDENPFDFSIQGTGTTDPKPTATTDAATSIAAYSATLNATVNANGLDTTVLFEYGTSGSYGSSISYGTLEVRGGGTTDVPVSKVISGLTADTDYFFRVVATNSSGTTNGNQQTFTTLQAIPEMDVIFNNLSVPDGQIYLFGPNFGSAGVTGGMIDKTFTIRNLGTGNLDLTGAPIVEITGAAAADFTVISGPSTTISPGGSTTFDIRFDPSTTGARIATVSIANDDANENPYNFEIWGSGVASPTGPTVLTQAATSVSVDSATLNGIVDDVGSNTTVTFEYGTTVAYGSTINAVPNSITAGSGATEVSANISGLSANTEYHFRVVGTNGYGTSNGGDLTFTTSNYTPVSLSIADAALMYTENDSATQLDSAAALVGGGEVEWANSSVTAQITGNPESTDELSIPDNVVGSINTLGMDVRTGSTVIGTVSAAEGTVTGGTMLTINFNGNANLTWVEQVIRALSYRSTSEDPSTSDRTVTVVAHNSYMIADTDTRTIQVQAENDDPSLTTNLGLTLNEGATAGIGTSVLSASDDDNSNTELTFTVTSGPLNGQLENTDNPGVAITSFTQQNLVNGKIQYVHDNTDTTTGSFVFTLSDTIANITNQTFSITVNPQADLPVVSTDPATGISINQAVLNGTVDDRDGDTTVVFEYGLDNTYGSTVAADQSPITSGSGSTAVSKTVAGFTGNTTYHYRVVATNSAGTVNGADSTFFIPEYSPITQSSGLNFSGTGFTSTTVNWTRGSGANCAVFVLEGSAGTAAPVDGITYSANSVFGSGSQIGSSGWFCVYNGNGSSVQITGLSLNTSYRVQVFEYNGSAGSELYTPNSSTENPANVTSLYGDIEIKGNNVAITDGSATSSTSNGTDFGSVSLSAEQKQVSFNIKNTGTGDLTLTGAPIVSVTGSGAGDFSVMQPNVSVLTADSSEIFKITFDPSEEGERKALVSISSDDSDESPFTFEIVGIGVPAKPTVTTGSATSVTYSKATLNGTVDDNGGETEVKFEYGFDSNYGNETIVPSSPLSSGSGLTEVTLTLSNLVKGMTYHYRLVASNAAGVSYGANQTVKIILDSESDGIDDEMDFDDDNDGIPDLFDKFPLNGNESRDSDGDGIGDTLDPDDDNDGIPDAQDAFPLDSNESVDTDGDGIGDNSDPEPLIPLDTDGDGDPDFSDPDDDNDGVPDAQDAFPLDNAESADTDFDGIGNNADTDDDGDGVDDLNDVFPLDPLEWLDSDGDGVGDNSDAFPNDASETHDTDGDGTGDNADLDADGDAVPDTSDAFPLDATESVDSDGDGVGDNQDKWPNDPSEALDTDGDGIGNNSDPDDDNDGILDVYDAFPQDPNYKLDSDGDGIPDAEDAFPTNPFEQNDNDFDGIGDNYDPDDDNDGIPDVADAYPFSPTQSSLLLAKGYRYNRDTNTYLVLDLKADTLLDSENVSYDLLTPIPPGITWNPLTGVFSGVVSVANNYTIEAEVSDGFFTIHVYYYVNIDEAIVNPFFTNFELNGVMSGIGLLQAPGFVELAQTESIEASFAVGTAYSLQLFTDFKPPYSGFGLMSGQLPAGMSLDSNTGVISGTPLQAHESTLVVYLLSWKGWAYQEINLSVTEAE